MNFQVSSFKTFKNKSSEIKKTAVEAKAESLGFESLTIEVVQYWNTKGIQNHQIKKTKILSRLNKILKNGIQNAPSLFCIDIIKETIDIYHKHLGIGFSKLSIGEGKVFKFSIDDFFKFSRYQKERIIANPRFEVLRNKRSLFISLYKDEEQFFYPQKEARIEFQEMYSAIINSLFNEANIKDDLRKYSQLTMQKFFDINKGKFVFFEGVISDYEVKNSQIFYTPEMFYNWLMKFITEKNKNMKVEHLNAKFFYENFDKWMYSIGRKA